MKPVFWMGSSKADLIAFPADARRDAGYQLDKLQRGEDPSDWKAMPTVGPGVSEIRVHEESGEFRVVFFARRPEGIYVLHCFRKKSRKTSGQDLRLAMNRFKAIPRSGDGQ